MALAGALCVSLLAVIGFTNKSLRALMTGLLGQPYSMNQASYDLARLRRNGLIDRIDHPNPYRLTADGLRVRDLLHQGPRPAAPTADGRRPTPSPTRATRRAAHHRPPHRRPPRRGTTTVGGCLTLWTSAKVLATKDR